MSGIPNTPCSIKCTRAHVYRKDGRLYVDYWGVDETNPKVEVHIPKISLDLKSMQFNIDTTKNWYTGSVITSREIIVSSDKSEYFEILVKNDNGKSKNRSNKKS